MDKYYDTPLKSIRKRCLDCTAWQTKEVRLCPSVDCSLYPYRFGRRPNKETIHTLKRFYAENVEPTKGF